MPPTPTDEPHALRVAFTADGDLWALELESAPTQLTDDGNVVDVRLTDDGDLIFYAVQDPVEYTIELRAMNFDGSGDRSLVDEATFDALYPLDLALHITLFQMAVVPGTHQLLFNTQALFEGPGLGTFDDLLSVDGDSGEFTTVLDPGDGGDFTLSPDGSQLAITQPDSIGFVNLDGSDLRRDRLTFMTVITYSEYLYYPSPIWYDGGVYAAIPAEDPFFGPQTGELWRVPSDGSQAELVASIEGNLFLPQREAPLIAPETAALAFLKTSPGRTDEQLWIQPIDSPGAAYDDGVIHWRGWSPTGSYFVYAKDSGTQLLLGQPGESSSVIGGGANLRWISPSEFLYLSGSLGDWTLTLSGVGGESTPLVDLAVETVTYDFAP